MEVVNGKNPNEPKPDKTYVLTVRETIEKPEWAESKSRAFYRNEDKREVFFMISQKPFKINSPGKIESLMEALKVIPETGDIFYMKLYIMKADIIRPITFNDFRLLLEQSYQTYQTLCKDWAFDKKVRLQQEYARLGYKH